jgi:UPF0271 protein
MTIKIDFNADMGESFGPYKLGFDEELIKYISSANIACGFHAGDPTWMRRTVNMAEAHGVGIGAQPSFPDLGGFGRRKMFLSPEEVRNDLTYQIGALTAFTEKKALQHVKPHGALYNMAVEDETLARAICQAVKDIDPNLILVVLAGSKWVEIAKSFGLRVAREAFADRTLTNKGTLTPRSEPGAVLHDINEVVKRSIRLVTEGKVKTVTGEDLDIEADSLCLHGDTPGAIEMAQALKSGLEAQDVDIIPIANLV